MLRNILIVFCICTIALFYFRSSNNVNGKNRLHNHLNSEKDSVIYDDSLKILNKWKLDSLGCLGYREKIVDTIISFINSYEYNINTIVDILGNPNEKHSFEAYTNLIYYSSTECNEEKLKVENIYCFIIIYIGKNNSSAFEDCH